MLWHDGPMRAFYAQNPLSWAFFSNYTLALEDDPAHPDLVSRAACLIAAMAPKKPISIACRGQIYILEPCENMALEATLEALIKDAYSSAPELEVGWLTCLPRPTQKLDTELFVALDTETEPKDLNELALYLAHGNLGNRWFTQPKQLIVFKNGRAGFNFDHAELDGEPAGRFIDALHCHPGQRPGIQENTGPRIKCGVTSNTSFKKLSWGYSRELDTQIQQAKIYAQQELAQREIWVTETRPFESDFQVQLAIQRVITELFKQPKVTSEAISMSHMPQGRYNTIYFDSPESVKNTYHEKIHAAKSGQEFDSRECEVSTSSGSSFARISVFGFTDTARNMIGIAYMRKPDKTVFHIKCDGNYLGYAQPIGESLIRV